MCTNFHVSITNWSILVVRPLTIRAFMRSSDIVERRSFLTNFNEEWAPPKVAAVAGINIKSFNILDIRRKVFSSTFFIILWGVDGSSSDWLQKHFHNGTSCSKQSHHNMWGYLFEILLLMNPGSLVLSEGRALQIGWFGETCFQVVKWDYLNMV